MKKTRARRHGVLSIPGRAEDGSDTAWFVVVFDERQRRLVTSERVGDGDVGRQRAGAIVRLRNDNKLETPR
jgi:hypothetical protein